MVHLLLFNIIALLFQSLTTVLAVQRFIQPISSGELCRRAKQNEAGFRILALSPQDDAFYLLLEDGYLVVVGRGGWDVKLQQGKGKAASQAEQVKARLSFDSTYTTVHNLWSRRTNQTTRKVLQDRFKQSSGDGLPLNKWFFSRHSNGALFVVNLWFEPLAQNGSDIYSSKFKICSCLISISAGGDAIKLDERSDESVHMTPCFTADMSSSLGPDSVLIISESRRETSLLQRGDSVAVRWTLETNNEQTSQKLNQSLTLKDEFIVCFPGVLPDLKAEFRSLMNKRSPNNETNKARTNSSLNLSSNDTSKTTPIATIVLSKDVSSNNNNNNSQTILVAGFRTSLSGAAEAHAYLTDDGDLYLDVFVSPNNNNKNNMNSSNSGSSLISLMRLDAFLDCSHDPVPGLGPTLTIALTVIASALIYGLCYMLFRLGQYKTKLQEWRAQRKQAEDAYPSGGLLVDPAFRPIGDPGWNTYANPISTSSFVSTSPTTTPKDPAKAKEVSSSLKAMRDGLGSKVRSARVVVQETSATNKGEMKMSKSNANSRKENKEAKLLASVVNFSLLPSTQQTDAAE